MHLLHEAVQAHSKTDFPMNGKTHGNVNEAVCVFVAGKLYDPSTKLIAGLKPAHFLTLATPHMGCDGQGPAQVTPLEDPHPSC